MSGSTFSSSLKKGTITESSGVFARFTPTGNSLLKPGEFDRVLLLLSGLEIDAGLLRGMEIKIESLKSLVAGGIAFATPDNPGDTPAKNGMGFPLYDEPMKEWLEWTPKIPIPAQPN